jgi:hypothetical protein
MAFIPRKPSMTKILIVALLTLLTCACGIHSLSAETVANSEAVPQSFDVAVPAQQKPADGGARTEVVAAKH